MIEGFHYDVFLNHNSEDRPRVRKLTEPLRAAGSKPVCDIRSHGVRLKALYVAACTERSLASSVSARCMSRPCGSTFAIRPSTISRRISRRSIGGSARRTGNPWMNGMRGIEAIIEGPKARNVIARPEGPGNRFHKITRGLKGRNNSPAACPTRTVPPLQGGRGLRLDLHLGLRAGRSTPGFHRTGFQPYPATDHLETRGITDKP